MKPLRPRRDLRCPLLAMLPRTRSVESEIRELSSRVRVLLNLLPVCRLADGMPNRTQRSIFPSAKD